MSTHEYSKAIKEFANSEVFFKIFDETIALVQKASDYLEGVGRFDQARLSPKDSTLFASYSVKLTNRLMQISSWLLGHRAYSKGEILEPKKIDLHMYAEEISASESLDKLTNSLPTRMIILITQTNMLFERIIRMDQQLKNLTAQAEEISDISVNNVHNQLEKIQQSFGLARSK